MATSSYTHERILADLEEIYRYALDVGNLAVATRIKELQGRAVGLFNNQPRNLKLPILVDLNDHELEDFVKNVEASFKELDAASE